MNKLVLVLVWILLVSNANTQFYLARITQGSPTTIDRYPIIAQLLLDAWDTHQYTQHCAGVILTARHVISTAHCFQYNENTGRDYSQPEFWKVRVGSSYRTHGGSIYNIKSIIQHPEFDTNYYNNDVAVLVVASRLVFSSSVRQATLIKQGVEIKPNSVAMLVGWGVTEGPPQHISTVQAPATGFQMAHGYTNVVSRLVFSSSVRQAAFIKQCVEIKPDPVAILDGALLRSLLTPVNSHLMNTPQPDQLQQTTIYTIDQGVCKQRYSTIQAIISNSMMCAGKLDVGGPDGCFGDSGGPLIYKGLVAGLVSFGYSCGHPFYPGVYTKVSHFTDWIVKTILSNK